MQALCHLASAEQMSCFKGRPACYSCAAQVRLPVYRASEEEPGNLSALDLPGFCGRLGG